MFDYNVAARQLYNQTTVSLAVFCNDRPDWRPTTFAYGAWGCRMELTFRIAKLLDHANDVEALEASANPLAAVVLAHLQAMKTRGDAVTRHQWKLRIVKGLYRKSWTKDDIRQLFRLIDWIMALPEDLEDLFETEMFRYEEEEKMPYVTSIERRALARGEAKGERKGLLRGIAAAVEAKFGRPGRKVLPKIRAITDLEQLNQFARRIVSAKTIDDLNDYLSR